MSFKKNKFHIVPRSKMKKVWPLLLHFNETIQMGDEE
jgi:hypothetical protein